MATSIPPPADLAGENPSMQPSEIMLTSMEQAISTTHSQILNSISGKHQMLPVVYIQTPSKISAAKPGSNNVVLNTMQLQNLTPVKAPAMGTQSVLLGKQPIVLQKPNSLQTVPLNAKNGLTYLTMLKPVKAKDQLVTNRVPIPTIKALTNETFQLPGQKFVLAPMPKVTTNRLPITATTNTVQSKISFMPIPLTKQKLINLKIPESKVPSDPSLSEPPADPVGHDLMCTEDLDASPEKLQEERPPLAILPTYDSENLLAPVEEDKVLQDTPKYSKHGVSILKRTYAERKEKPVVLQAGALKYTTISDTDTKEVKITSEQNAEEPAAEIQKKVGRRKSTICLRKDFDDGVIIEEQREEAPQAKIPKMEQDNGPQLCESKEVKDTDMGDVEAEILSQNIKSAFEMDDYDVAKLLVWEDGVGTLPSSDLKFIMNEFGFLEYLTNEDYGNLMQRKKQQLDKKKEAPEDMLCCVECNCYGLPFEFVSQKYCSYDCQTTGEKEAAKALKKKKRAQLKNGETKPPELSDDGNTSNENSVDKFAYPWTCNKKGFSWAKYLDHVKAKAAPVKLFKDPFPYNRNGFRPGMKLEGIDPQHPSYFCVLTVAVVQGYRMRLHFDGYPDNYDFWINADSMDIFPLGFCEKFGHTLHPPPGYEKDFNWNFYLKYTRSTAAPKQLFVNKGNQIYANGFRTGMKLEAVDKKNTTLVCVATITDMMDNRILVHFDSWDDIYDYWADPTSPFIHPVSWCDQNGHRLTPPNDYPDPENFTWERYLKETKSVAAPVRAFKQRPGNGFKKGMRLECVDRRVPQLIRVATVDDVKDHQVRISFDGWPDRYCYWMDDDSPDIHPVGWCHKTGHHIEPPLTPDDVYDFLECATVGCRGQGHIKGPVYPTHALQKNCPYAEENLDLEKITPDRLLTPDLKIEAVVPVSREPKEKPRGRVGRPPKYPRPPSEPMPPAPIESPRLSCSPKREWKDDDLDDDDDDEDDAYGQDPEWVDKRIEKMMKKSKSPERKDDEMTLRPVIEQVKPISSPIHILPTPDVDEALTNASLIIPLHEIITPDDVYEEDISIEERKMRDLHSQYLKDYIESNKNDPRDWSSEHVAQFVDSIPACHLYSTLFAKHRIDGMSLLMLTQQDLIDVLTFKLGPAITLYNCIVLLRRSLVSCT